MAKYLFKDQVTPERIVEDLKSKLGSEYNIYSKKVKETASRIFIRKNAAIGCSLRYVIKDGAVTCYGPFAYYSIGFALLSVIGVLAIFSAAVTKLTGQFNVVIGGLIPVGLAAVLVRLPSRDIVTRVGSIMRTVEGGLKPAADSIETSTTTPHEEAATTAEELGKVKSYVQLFDRKRYGINYAFLIAFVSASIINTSCNHFLSFGFENMSVYLPLILANIVVSCIYGLLLLLLSHLVKRNWLLPFFWALITFIPQGLFFSGMEAGAYAAAGGFLFMAGLILAIQLWGVRIWSLMIGLIGIGLLAGGSFYMFYGLQMSDAARITLSVITILISVVLQALILYAGFYLHLQRANAHRKSMDSQYSRA